MKISIVGPCSGGKTTFSKKMGERLGIEAVNLDEIYVDYKNITPDNVSFNSESKIKTELEKIFKKESWIIEGIYPIEEGFEKADVIIFICRPFLLTLFWQWKRFFVSKEERTRFGFRQNLALTLIIWHQYFGREERFRCVGYDYPTIQCFNSVLKKYKNKVYLFSWFGEEILISRIKSLIQ